MSPDNRKRIQEAVKVAGLDLEGKLPPVEGLTARNPYAHLWKCIKEEYGKSYKDCEDHDVDGILDLIEHCRRNPE